MPSTGNQSSTSSASTTEKDVASTAPAAAAAAARTAVDWRHSDERSGCVERVRVLPPAPPYAPGTEAIPSTITTPTLVPASRNSSFHRAAHGSDVSATVQRQNSSFVSAAGIYVTSDRHHQDNENGSSISGHRRAHVVDRNGNGENDEEKDALELQSEVASPTTLQNGDAAGGENAARTVNRRAAMLGYFGYMFGSCVVSAYFGVILKTEKGFSATAVGLLVSAIPIYQIVLLPFLSFIADRYNCAAKMLSVCAVGSTAMVLLFTTASSTTATLVAYFVLIAFQTPMNPLLDKHTLLMFPAKGRTAAWGYVRSYGAYGWGVGNPVAGALVQWTGKWAVVAVQYAVGQIALLYCMYATHPYEVIDHATSSSVRFRDVLDVLLRHQRLLLFLFASCMMGMGYSFINNFLFIFLEELGGSTFLMGVTLLVTVSTEIPLFQNSDRLNEWLTERQMMTCAMVLWSVRVVGYSFLNKPWLVLFLEPLHGVTFALMWLPGVKLISETFPPKLASSATGVLFTFVSGFGAIIGNVFAGLLYDLVGARWMFRIAAVTMLTALSIYVLLDHYLEHKGLPLGKPDDASDGGVVVEAVDTASAGGGGERAEGAEKRNYSFNKWEERNMRT